MAGDMPVGFRVRAHRGWSQTGGLIGAGVAGLLVIAGCTGTGPGALGPLAKVTIVSGNLTFSSAAGGARRAGAPARRSGERGAGDAIVGGLSGSEATTRRRAVQARLAPCGRSSGRSRASGGTAAPVDLRPDLGVRVAVRDGRLTGVSVRPVAGKTRPGRRPGRPGRRWPGRMPPVRGAGARAGPWRRPRPTGSPRRPWIPPASAPSWPAISARCDRAVASPRARFSARGRRWAWVCPS